MEIEIRFFAAARAAAGTSALLVQPAKLSEILQQITSTNADLMRIIPQCSFLVNALAVHDLEIEVNAGSVIDVLPRFAGG